MPQSRPVLMNPKHAPIGYPFEPIKEGYWGEGPNRVKANLVKPLLPWDGTADRTDPWTVEKTMRGRLPVWSGRVAIKNSRFSRPQLGAVIKNVFNPHALVDDIHAGALGKGVKARMVGDLDLGLGRHGNVQIAGVSAEKIRVFLNESGRVKDYVDEDKYVRSMIPESVRTPIMDDANYKMKVNGIEVKLKPLVPQWIQHDDSAVNKLEKMPMVPQGKTQFKYRLKDDDPFKHAETRGINPPNVRNDEDLERLYPKELQKAGNYKNYIDEESRVEKWMKEKREKMEKEGIDPMVPVKGWETDESGPWRLKDIKGHDAKFETLVALNPSNYINSYAAALFGIFVGVMFAVASSRRGSSSKCNELLLPTHM